MDRLRVLNAIQGWAGEFTAAELSAKTGVNIATVRTILYREEPRFLERRGNMEAAGRGGRAVRFAVKPSTAEQLREELESIREDFVEVYRREPRVELEGSYVEPPLSLQAAEDALRREFKQADSRKEKLRILASAREDLAAACALIASKKDDTLGMQALRHRLVTLEFEAEEFGKLLDAAEKQAHPTQFDVGELIARARKETEAERAADTFEENVPSEALQECDPAMLRDFIVDVDRKPSVTVPPKVLPVLCCEPVAYKPEVISYDPREKTWSLNSFWFHKWVGEAGPPRTQIAASFA